MRIIRSYEIHIKEKDSQRRRTTLEHNSTNATITATTITAGFKYYTVLILLAIQTTNTTNY